MESISHSVTNFEIMGPYRLRVFFEDDTIREIDFLPVLAGRLFSPLKDLSLFNQVAMEDDLLTWPNGADISPDTLYHWPDRLPVLYERAREWKRGFKAEDIRKIVFDWDEINEIVDGDVAKYRKKISFFYDAIGRLELDVEVSGRLYSLEPHPHILRRKEALQETIREFRKQLESCMAEFGDKAEKRLFEYCTARRNTSPDSEFMDNEIKEQLKELKAEFSQAGKEWRWHVTRVITEIPRGNLATYGCIANTVNERFGHAIIARNVAWLRGYLYGILTHDTLVPLHRVAKAGDVHSLADSSETKSYNDRRRGMEGSLTNPIWWHPLRTSKASVHREQGAKTG